jgi:hypothetical protein
VFRSLKNVAFACALAAGLGIGCDDTEDAVDEVEEFFDCSAICSAFELCVDDDGFDTTACVDDCEDNADLDDAFEQQAEDCTDCVETDSCDEGVWQCDAVCAGIVP